MNGDGRDDVVCATGNGGIIVWISKVLDSGTFYNPTDHWKDELFGFCLNSHQWVRIRSDINQTANKFRMIGAEVLCHVIRARANIHKLLRQKGQSNH